MRSRRQRSRFGAAATFLLFQSSLLTTKNFSSSRQLSRSFLVSAFSPSLQNLIYSSKLQTSRSLSSSPFTESINDIQMFHYKSISSTQDEMKSLLLKTSEKKADYICITTDSQTQGRGTNNRSWIGKRGNTFLTIAIPYDDIQIPLTLFPLQIGVVMAQNIQKVLENTDLKPEMPKVTVKWPNDVLVNDKKIAGVLIENEKDCNGQYRFLIGIGVNNRYAPTVETTGEERGRATTCIYDYKEGDIDEEVAVMEARQLAVDIANDIKSWIEIQKIDPEGSRNMIVNTWLQWADFSRKFVLRDEPGNETVMPIDLESDGRLRVVGQNGQERLLCFDYLL